MHKTLKEFWRELGLMLDFDVTTEYNIEGDYIDVVWKKGNELIFIEIEDKNSKMQIWKNMTKGVYLKPKVMIFDCVNESTSKFIESKKRHIDIPIKIFNRNDNNKKFKSSSEILMNLASKKYSKKEIYYCSICKKRLLLNTCATILAVHPSCYHNL